MQPNIPEQEINAYKSLAAEILVSALEDLNGNWDERRDRARRFLFDLEQAGNRAVWLAWLGLNDEQFRAMLLKDKHQGFANRIKNIHG